MSSQDRIWEDLTWNWAYSTGSPASDHKLGAAAKAAWPYALLCAYTYLNDRDVGHDLMDHAVQNAVGYIERHSDASTEKLSARIKSMIRRRAKQLAAKRRAELSYGSLSDLEKLYAGQPEAEQRVYANEIFARLTPFAQSIIKWRWLGYSWREISNELEMDHTVVRRAYFRELKSLLATISKTGGAA